MKCKKILWSILAGLAILLFAKAGPADHASPAGEAQVRFAQRADSEAGDECPGWIFGEWREKPEALFREHWAHRRTTYEILFPSQQEIARTIYGLALFAKDLDQAVTLERFSRGAMGFHYSIGQILDWVNAISAGNWAIQTREEETLLNYLLFDGVIIEKKGGFEAGRGIRHIVGAAAGNKRSLFLNLNHERFHVLWDEDLLFKMRWVSKWEELSDDQKAAVYKRLKGYNQEDEMQVIEEWAVRQNEARPIKE